MLTPTDQPVAIYARYSTDRQDARSIDDQVRRCRAHASSHGLHVVAEYKDAAISGAHVDRADIQRLLGAARAKGGAPFSSTTCRASRAISATRGRSSCTTSPQQA